jgi:hypothetical protein
MKPTVLSLALMLALTACGTPAAAPESRRAALPFSLEPGGDVFHGTVTESLPAGSYLYLRVDDAWVVSMKKPTAVGDRVRVKPFGVAREFHSKRLGRVFDALQFSVVTKEQ